MFNIFVLTLLFIIIPNTSYAYIDPGSGSAILMGLLALLTGGLVFVKNLFTKVKIFIINFFIKVKIFITKKK